MLGNEIGLSWLQLFNGYSFVIGFTLPSFHEQKTICCCSERLNSCTITGTKTLQVHIQ